MYKYYEKPHFSEKRNSGDWMKIKIFGQKMLKFSITIFGSNAPLCVSITGGVLALGVPV